MATIRKRGSRYNVQIRKEGYPSITKTFTHRSVAKKWASSIEADMERHLYIEMPDQTTVEELLKRYQRQVLPSHKGQQVERYRLGTLKKHLGSLRLIHLTSKEMASYRDIRLQEISPTSLKRELTILSQVLTVASKDWGSSDSVKIRNHLLHIKVHPKKYISCQPCHRLWHQSLILR